MNSKVTITDVATTAGISLGTVSRVLNNDITVSPDKRQRVYEAIQKLGYKRLRGPRKISSSRESRRTGAIGIVLLGMDNSLVNLPAVSAAFHGAEEAISARNKNVFISEVPHLDRVPHFLTNNQVDGLILKGPLQGGLPSPSQNKLIRALARFPGVWIIGRPFNSWTTDVCQANNDAVGRLAAEYLKSKGHTHVGILNPKGDHLQFREKCDAFMAHCKSRTMEVSSFIHTDNRRWTWPLKPVMESTDVEPLLEKWLALPKSRRPTALFTPADSIAIQLYPLLSRRRMSIGQDLSLISCNHEPPLMAGLYPALTTIDIHSRDIGVHAVDQLLWRLEHPDEQISMTLKIEPTLAEGGSVCTLKKPSKKS